jgi:hypothetical protein
LEKIFSTSLFDEEMLSEVRLITRKVEQEELGGRTGRTNWKDELEGRTEDIHRGKFMLMDT